MKKKPEHPLERIRHPDVFAPGEELPEVGKKETIFKPGGLVTLAVVIVMLTIEIWLRLNGRSIFHFIFGY